MQEQCLHPDAEILLAAVDGGPVLGPRPMRRLPTPARIGATTCPRRASSAAMVRRHPGGRGNGESGRACG
jgi:hypothetical protein